MSSARTPLLNLADLASRRGYLVGLVAGLVSLSCATVGPDFEPPTAELSPAWLEASAAYRPTPQEIVEWWRVFDDPTLNELVNQARTDNNDIRIAGLRVLEARAQLALAIGVGYPQSQVAVADATALEASESNANTAGGGDLRYTQYNLGVSAVWEIDFWGRFRRGVESADASLLASIASYDEALVLVTATVADVYVVLRSTEEQLRIARNNVDLQQRSYEIADVLFRNGEVAELDALQARTLLLSTQATVPALETTLRKTQHALSTLLGRSTADVAELLGADGDLPEIPENIAVGIPADLSSDVQHALRLVDDYDHEEAAEAIQHLLLRVTPA